MPFDSQPDIKLTELERVDAVRPMFEKYMWIMEQYHVIDDISTWTKNALDYLKLYETEAGRHIYSLSFSDNTEAGFALVNQHFRFNTEGRAIAEFYIAPEHQRNGLGRQLATIVFDRHPGIWEVCVMSKNIEGYKFWHRIISDYTGGEYGIKESKSYQGHGFIFSNA